MFPTNIIKKDRLSIFKPVLFFGFIPVLYHERSDECEDGVELRESGVDHGVGLNIVTL